ncbi:MAG: hypothetical protein IJ168_10920, partial [Eubacterium sp.]|nr:hypothetical protein [Eubacterium sp.]
MYELVKKNGDAVLFFGLYVKCWGKQKIKTKKDNTAMAEFSHCCVRRLRGKHKQNSDSKTVKA